MVIKAVSSLGIRQWAVFLGGPVDSGEVHRTRCGARGRVVCGGSGGLSGGCGCGSLWGLKESGFVVQFNAQLDEVVEDFRGRGLVPQCCLKTMVRPIYEKRDLGSIIISECSGVSHQLGVVGTAVFVILAEGM